MRASSVHPDRRAGTPRSLTLLPLLVGLIALGGCGGTADFRSPEVDVALDQLRALANQRAWSEGIALGEEWAAKVPRSTELRAWHIYHRVRGASEPETTLEMAEALRAERPDDPWSAWALALALDADPERGEEALPLSAEAFEAMPDHVEFARLRADVLRDQESPEASIAFIDGLPPELRNTATMLNRRAVAIHTGSYQNEELDVEDAFAAFAAAREADPNDVDSRFLAAAYLTGARRADEALPLLEEALELSPRTSEIHSYYWRAITAQTDLTAEEKEARVRAGVEALLAHDPASPAALSAAANQYEQMELLSEKNEMQDRLLAAAPESPEAEWVHVNRYRETRTEMYELATEAREAREAGDEARAEELEAERDALKPGLRAQLDAFIARERHHRETLLGDAYRELYRLLSEEDDVDPDLLLEVVRGFVEYEGINTHLSHAAAPITLAEKTPYAEEALGIVLEGFEITTEDGLDVKERGIFDTEGEWEESMRWRYATLYDALGWIHYQAGREEDAEHLLVKAAEISRRSPQTFHHLGQLYEARYDAAAGGELDDVAALTRFYELAEDAYMTGAGLQSMGTNPNDEALEGLYEKRYGSLDGFEVYLADFEARDRQRRRQETLDERIGSPEPHPVFALLDLDGNEVSSEDLAGKTVVVNFWGVWCGPCVAEMPDIQKFHEGVADEEDVVFLTINNDQNPDEAREYMAKNRFTFPVLLDDGYVRDARVSAFPTTWFIGPDGRIEFSKRGWSEKLVEEFDWRVEAIRGSQ